MKSVARDTHALLEIRQKLKDLGLLQRHKAEDGTLRVMTNSFFIRQGYNLSGGLEGKLADVHKFATWTIFCNNAGTLIHAVHKEGDFHVRIPMRPNIKGCSDAYIERLMLVKLDGKFIL